MKFPQRVKWLDSEKICIAHGSATAKTLMFETKSDHALFLSYWEKYLGDMLELIHYKLSSTQWVLLFRTKDDESIRKAYKALRKKSKKAKKSKSLKDVQRILSEHFRIFLSQYVRRSNAISGREGSKVKCRFKKYIVKDLSEYEEIFNTITEEEKPSQKYPRYQADEGEYDELKEMQEDSVWKIGTRIYAGLEKYDKVLKKMVLLLPSSDVLRKFLSTSKHPPIPYLSP